VVLLLLVLLPWAGPRWGLGPELWPLWGVALAGVPFAIANGVLGGVLRHQFRSGAFAWFSAVQGLLIVALSLGLALGTQGGVAGAVAGLSLAHAVVFPLRAWHLRHWLRRSEALQAPGPLLAYGWPLVLASMAQWVFSASDRFVLTGLVSVAESGRYGVAVSLASVLGFLATAIGQAWGPMAIQSHERHPQWTPVFFGEVLAYLLVIFGWLSVVMAWWAPELVQALAGANFGDAALALGPLALGATALVTTQVTALGISLSKQTTWFARYAWQSAALNLVLNLALVPQGGMVASAWATMISSSYLTLAYAWRSQRLVPFRVLWGTLAGAVGLSLVGVVVVAPWWRAGPLEPWFWVAKGFASLGWGGLMAASLGLTWWQKRWAWASARWRP
jgi:O-antigen/teichoic acid export membrane protein